MENLSDIRLDVNQHRLIMCMRMAKAMGKGDIYLDATTHRMCWRMENSGVTTGVFDSIDKMEEYLEHLLENRSRLASDRLDCMHPAVRRRLGVITERNRSRTNGRSMTFNSRINRM